MVPFILKNLKERVVQFPASSGYVRRHTWNKLKHNLITEWLSMPCYQRTDDAWLSAKPLAVSALFTAQCSTTSLLKEQLLRTWIA